MSDDKRDPSLPAEYALGLLRGGQRAAVEADRGLRKDAEGWQAKLVALDAADSEPVPEGSFEKILARIDEAGMQLPGTATQRATDAEWQQHSEGIVFRVLKVDEARRRQTLLVKMQPGAVYKSHAHDVEEECLVIEGDLSYGDFVLRAGDYHLARAGTHHPIGTTAAGCLLHVVVGMEI
ncbi:cupin domain-containing protein [Bradyrhizobium sp.]|uniref:cupin domain-containing protein n=1 Tax=Bradyrhizobium sp. TaxID=376 RepID=UPI004037DBD6